MSADAAGVYYESYQYAVDNQESGPYWESYNCNRECRHAIEEAIADHYDGYHMDNNVGALPIKRVDYIQFFDDPGVLDKVRSSFFCIFRSSFVCDISQL